MAKYIENFQGKFGQFAFASFGTKFNGHNVSLNGATSTSNVSSESTNQNAQIDEHTKSPDETTMDGQTIITLPPITSPIKKIKCER